MTCAETLRTQAFIDGELDGDAVAESERHIESCAECQEFCASAAALSDALRKPGLRYTVPSELRLRVGRILDEEVSGPQTGVVIPLKATRRSFWLGAAGGTGITGLAAALAFLMILPPSAGTLSEAITDAHTQALMSGHEIEVVSSNHHTVKPWFAGRVDVSPPVADFADQGFKLVGGRVDKMAGASAAVVVYRHGNHEIDLFVWADQGSQLPSSGLRHGYQSVFWKRGDLAFAAVCDMQGSELAKFVNLVHSEPE